MDASLAMQGAILARLQADPTVTSLIGDRIYDYVPESEDPLGIYPFVAIGDFPGTRWRVLGADGWVGALTLDIYSEYRGWKEALEIRDAIQTAIESAPITVDGLNVVRCEYRNHHRIHNPDGRTRHVPAIFAVEVQYT